MGTNLYPQFPIRIEPATINKMKYIASYNGRSTAKEIEQLMLKHIEQYEEVHGEISLEQITEAQEKLRRKV